MRLPIAALLAWTCLATSPSAETAGSWQHRLIAAASSQIGVTTRYDPAYTRLAFPDGDVPRERGVCTDVVVRAYRDAFKLDLQAAVNTDMKLAFANYPRNWGLKRPDSNIDHRRVANLQVFFSRNGQSLPVTRNPADYAPGDLVTQMLPGNLPHIAIVSAKTGPSGAPKVIHNIGAGAREEDSLFAYPLTGHYRFKPSARSSAD